jgi:sporulation-control protein spo0M
MPLNNYSLTKTFGIKNLPAKEVKDMLDFMKPSITVTAIGAINIWVNETANTISVGISSDNEKAMVKTMEQIEELISANDVKPWKKEE